MAQSASDTNTDQPSTLPSADLGANEWLVDEMREQYDADPASVGPEWARYFETNGSGGGGNGTPASAPAQQKVATRASDAEPAAKKQVATGSSDEQPAGKKAEPAAPKATPRPAAEAAEPAKGTTEPVPKDAPKSERPAASDEPQFTVLRGAPARTASNMDASLTVPTATSVRSVPVKLLWDNRTVINNHLARARGGKVSFTHLIGFALVRALRSMPEMNVGFDVIDGKPNLITPAHINLGLAIDVKKDDGTRQLLVPSIKAAERMDFAAFWTAYEEIVRKTRNNKLTIEDFQGTTISLTNPGGIGTVHSVPRLMKGQGAIIGVGAMEYPPEWQGASEEAIARNAISKVMTLTSTYDHRVIQGAQSGEFLKRIHQLLLGEDNFYDDVFSSLRIPYEPVRWVRDIHVGRNGAVDKTARVLEIIDA